MLRNSAEEPHISVGRFRAEILKISSECQIIAYVGDVCQQALIIGGDSLLKEHFCQNFANLMGQEALVTT